MTISPLSAVHLFEMVCPLKEDLAKVLDRAELGANAYLN
jgi:hypothetical protein